MTRRPEPATGWNYEARLLSWSLSGYAALLAAVVAWCVTRRATRERPFR